MNHRTETPRKRSSTTLANDSTQAFVEKRRAVGPASRMPKGVRRVLTKTNIAIDVAIAGNFKLPRRDRPFSPWLNAMVSLDYDAVRALYEGELCSVPMHCVRLRRKDDETYSLDREPCSA